MNEHKCAVSDRVEVARHVYSRGLSYTAYIRGTIERLGRENSVGGDREDGYYVLLDSGQSHWAFEWEVRKLNVLELLAEAADGR